MSGLSLGMRATLGVVVIAVVGAMFVVAPDALAWIHTHRFTAAAATLAGSVFHVWNTYRARPETMR
jgi:uncharacterized membrane protein